MSLINRFVFARISLKNSTVARAIFYNLIGINGHPGENWSGWISQRMPANLNEELYFFDDFPVRGLKNLRNGKC